MFTVLLYYDNQKFKLYHANCLDVLAELPENSVDMVFADPPYLLSNGGFTVHAGRRVSVNKGEWDKSNGLKKILNFMLNNMKQHEAVIKVMEQNDGFATLGYLNREVLKVPGVEWKTKTPFASIRRIVQDERFFFKIKPGLWALLSHKNKLPQDILPTGTIPKQEQELFNHSYYQGLLVEIGKLKQYETFVPNQDKNKRFLGKTLGETSSQADFYQFGYDHFVRKARTIDVCWFNVRKMPAMLFEVEHSTDIQNSLLKFVELQDFNTNFFIVADKARKTEYAGKLSLTAFMPIKTRVQFMDYEKLSEWHTKTFEVASVESSLTF